MQGPPPAGSIDRSIDRSIHPPNNTQYQTPTKTPQTYGAFARTFGFGLLAFKIWTARSATGVSFKSLQLYALVFFFRLTSIIPFSGYLPYDKYVRATSFVFCFGCINIYTKYVQSHVHYMYRGPLHTL